MNGYEISIAYEHVLTTTWIFRSNYDFGQINLEIMKLLGDNSSFIVTEIARYTHVYRIPKAATSIMTEAVLSDRRMLSIKNPTENKK